MKRKKRLKIIQVSLLVATFFIVFFTFSQKNKISEQQIILKETKKKIENQLNSQKKNEDIFYNVEFSGLDLAGNRYVLKSKEAFANKKRPEIIAMKAVEGLFFFKDETILYVWSDKGIYNNKTLDIEFTENVKSEYENSTLSAEKVKYSNSKSIIIISDKVKVNDIKGAMVADKLIFDIEKKKLNISSFDNKKINANLNLK
jgi:lipopolysaccharide export system protein LptA